MAFVRTTFRRLLWQMLKWLGKDAHIERIVGPVIVFSPHFDDETLGCGGTIARLCRQGVEVHIVFMTDGAKSHCQWMDEQQLSRLRGNEGRAAAEALGVAPRQIHLLNYGETSLSEQALPATAAAVELLASIRPEAVFVPYFRDPPADHLATNRIVQAALEQPGRALTVWEYPIWYWHHLPWTPPSSPLRLTTAVKQSVLHALRLLRECRAKVLVADEIDQKRRALELHRTQMFRQGDHPDWPILADVSQGEFLACFFREYEFFFRRQVAGTSDALPLPEANQQGVGV